MRPHSPRVRACVHGPLACAALAALCHAAPVHAADFALGEIAAPVSLAIGNAGLLGPFSDAFSFSIGATDRFEFESFVSTGFSNRGAIPDMIGTLYSNGAVLASGLAQTVTLPEGFPSREITFAPLQLVPGDYRLVFSGEAISFDPSISFTSGYTGSVTFSPMAAIPEPSTTLLAAVGLLALLLAVRRNGRRLARPR